jgi:myo-inositol-1(or 4)-monophosphatase
VAATDIDLLTGAAREAGALALTYFQRNPKTWPKGETSIVSEADYAVDKLLATRLLDARPDYGWLSEETIDDPAQRARPRIFIVDPIDGTKGFLAGGSEWTISLAVVEGGRPIAAALFAPALGTMFQAVVGEGAFVDGQRMSVSGRTELAGANVAGSRRLVREALELASVSLEYRGFISSLAYRFALVAAGEVDVAIARPGAYDWDLAACDLLVHEAGGRLADLAGRQPRYNGVDRRHPTVLASTPALSEAMTRLVERVEKERSGEVPTRSN